jgi:hypothetical protein
MTAFFSDGIIDQLKAPLSGAHVKTRPHAGRKLSYLEAWHVIAEANRIFGFDGWNREMADCRCVAERETKMGQPFDEGGNPQKQRDGWRVGYVARVRVTIGPVVREGCGYGSGIDADLGSAHESALKEAESDAMKRALMTFGNQFGLALYDKAQANVEAPTRPAATSARPSSFGGAVPQNGTRAYDQAISAPPPGKRPSGLAEIRDAIKHAMEIADSRDRIDGILRVHRDNLQEIKAASMPTYDRLMRIAEERKAELVEPPPRIANTGSAPELKGEP